MTPAILLVRKAKIAHDVLAYEHDPAAESYGREAVDALRLEPATVFKTLVADAEGVPASPATAPI
jgi:Cys-tRNA(Pro)/Cys-tRNA(Cys) deacylase